jgi:hypothetical protein
MAGRVMSRPFVKGNLSADAPVTPDKLFDWSNSVEWLECFVFLFEIISAEHDIDWVNDLAETIFDKKKNALRFLSNRIKLAARVLADRHIHLSAEWREELAEKCAREAIDDWGFGQIESEVLKNLAETEFVAVFVEDEAEVPEASKSLATRHLKEFGNPEIFKRLNVLIATGRSLTDLTPINAAKNLQHLSLVNTGVSDISCLRSNSELETVLVRDTPVSDISVLSELSKLEVIDFRGADVSQLPDLSKAKHLHIVDIGSTNIVARAGFAKPYQCF